MEMEGWIKLYRKISDNELWLCEPFTRGQAWIDLILLANHVYSYFYCREHKIEVKRGEVGYSQVKLAKRWKWSRSKVKKFLNDLEKEHQIIQQQSKSYSIIQIVNYEKYQNKEQQEVHQQDISKTSARHQQDINKNDNNDKNEKKEEEKQPEKVQVLPPIDFIDQIINAFAIEYENINQVPYAQIAKGKERSAAGKILNLHKKKHPEMNSRESLDSLRLYFRACVSIDDDWLRNNMSLPMIVSKFNEINNKLRNGPNKRFRGVGATDAEIAEIIARKFAVDRPG